MIDDASGSRTVRVGDPGPRPVHLLFSEPTRPFEDDPILGFLVKARGQRVSIETSVEFCPMGRREPST